MRSTAHVMGHPIHPMLIGFPFAYLFGAAIVDTWGRVSEHRTWHRTARHMSGLGIGSALIAAIPGVIDYLLSVPPHSSAKERATTHMLTNLSALALFTAARFRRGDSDDPPPAWAVVAEVCGAGLLAAAGWLGGTLVYRNQIGVDHRFANAGTWRVDTKPDAIATAEWIDAAAADELDVDQMKLIRVAGRRIVVARTEGGFAAFDDRCTHRGGPLSDGALVCGTVQCPWHGSQFDVDTGKVDQGPATQPIDVYDVEEVDGRVRIRIG